MESVCAALLERGRYRPRGRCAGTGTPCSALAAFKGREGHGEAEGAQPSPAGEGQDSQCGKQRVSGSRGKDRPCPASSGCPERERPGKLGLEVDKA